MGPKHKKGRGRLRGIAVSLAAAAASFLPNVALAAALPLPEAIEAEALAARFTRAENALAQAVARTDRATLRVFACDCAARVAPLYERAGRSADLLWQARAQAIAAAEAAHTTPGRAAPRRPADLFGAFAKAEREIVSLETEVAREGAIARGAAGALGEVVFARCEQQVSRLEDRAAADGDQPDTDAADDEPPFRMLAVAMAAARAIDDAVLVAAGGSLSRIDTMSEAIAEAVYLDHVFRRGERAPAVNAVFRELAWQRSHLRALRSNA